MELFNAVNLERLTKIGKLMDRTMADKDGSGPVVPLPPPPPPPLPEPPTVAVDVDPEGMDHDGAWLCDRSTASGTPLPVFTARPLVSLTFQVTVTLRRRQRR